jgi:hypothetical protein
MHDRLSEGIVNLRKRANTVLATPSKLPRQRKTCSMEFPMSPEAILVQPAVLLTIISETVLRDRIVQLLKSLSVTGYTINQVQGEGGHGRRLGDIAGYNTNIEIKTLVSPEVSDAILWSIKEHQGNHALIAFRQNVEALY